MRICVGVIDFNQISQKKTSSKYPYCTFYAAYNGKVYGDGKGAIKAAEAMGEGDEISVVFYETSGDLEWYLNKKKIAEHYLNV